MTLSTARQSLGFSTQFGRFTIVPDGTDAAGCALNLSTSEAEVRELGKFRCINDAVVAVARQETGWQPWDALSLREIPYRVHDLTCWDFEDFIGTKG